MRSAGSPEPSQGAASVRVPRERRQRTAGALRSALRSWRAPGERRPEQGREGKGGEKFPPASWRILRGGLGGDAAEGGGLPAAPHPGPAVLSGKLPRCSYFVNIKRSDTFRASSVSARVMWPPFPGARTRKRRDRKIPRAFQDGFAEEAKSLAEQPETPGKVSRLQLYRGAPPHLTSNSIISYHRPV